MRLPFWPHSPGLPRPTTEAKTVSLPRRYARLLGIAAVTSFVLIFIYFDKLPVPASILTRTPKLPPLYEKYHEFERNLPQHDPTLPYPEGKHAKFLHFANHQYEAGWGNALQELFLNAHLAIKMKRSYVFDNYTWEHGTNPYADWKGNTIPARIPLSAHITGPLAGGSLGPGYEDVPRPVSAEYFYKECPKPLIIDPEPIRVKVGWPTTTQAIIKAAMEEFEKYKDERCLEIEIYKWQIFNVYLLGMDYVLDVWPDLKFSPVITNFGWAPLITNAYAANRHIWESSALPPSRFAALISSGPSNIPTTIDTLPEVNHTTRSLLPGTIAIHVRRNDFLTHCEHMAKWSSHFNGFNSFPELPDKFKPPPGNTWGENTPENYIIYRKHCFPTLEQIVEKVIAVKKSHQRKGEVDLRRLYIMTNAKPPWLSDLIKAFENADPGGWDLIASSRDLKLNWEQKFVSAALDMYVGSRAEVFIGNGFSSLTSNVVMLRMAYNRDPNDTRFW